MDVRTVLLPTLYGGEMSTGGRYMEFYRIAVQLCDGNAED